MSTTWSPFPTYSLVYTPTVGAALNLLKNRYAAGKDYFQDAAHEPPYMSDELIADFQKVYDETVPKIMEVCNQEFIINPKYGQMKLSDHFTQQQHPFGTPSVVVKVAQACHKMQQLVNCERWCRQSVLASQQRREQEEQKSKEAWTAQKSQFTGQSWPGPGNPQLVNYMAIRIQNLEEQVAKLIEQLRTNGDPQGASF
jgi:hypothetical protein